MTESTRETRRVARNPGAKHTHWMEKLQTSIDNTTLFAQKPKKNGANPKWRPTTAASVRKIGLDFGGVIVGGEEAGTAESQRQPGCENSDDTTMFGENYLQTPEVPGALHAVRAIVLAYGAPNVYVVSKARREMRRKTSEWLDCTGFCDRSGLWRCNVLFCRERVDKGPIAEKLILGAFVDDKEQCLTCMPDTVSLRLLFGGEGAAVEERMEHGNTGELTVVADWDAVLSSLGISVEGKST